LALPLESAWVTPESGPFRDVPDLPDRDDIDLNRHCKAHSAEAIQV